MPQVGTNKDGIPSLADYLVYTQDFYNPFQLSNGYTPLSITRPHVIIPYIATSSSIHAVYTYLLKYTAEKANCLEISI